MKSIASSLGRAILWTALCLLTMSSPAWAGGSDDEAPGLPKKAEINLKGLEQVIAFMGEAGNLTPPLPAAERFVDLQYLHAAGIK